MVDEEAEVADDTAVMVDFPVKIAVEDSTAEDLVTLARAIRAAAIDTAETLFENPAAEDIPPVTATAETAVASTAAVSTEE